MVLDHSFTLPQTETGSERNMAEQCTSQYATHHIGLARIHAQTGVCGAHAEVLPILFPAPVKLSINRPRDILQSKSKSEHIESEIH